MIAKYSVGALVTKRGSDYYFHGTVVAVFQKLHDGPVRYVVEDDRGTLFIQSEDSLIPRVPGLTQEGRKVYGDHCAPWMGLIDSGVFVPNVNIVLSEQNLIEVTAMIRKARKETKAP